MASKKFVVSDLDFDDIKSNLKAFLQDQTQFSDYNFEGSGFSVLLDTLAYNTHYLGFNANMLANELYLDSADIRKNIVSLAKMLGYTPSSPKSPRPLYDDIAFRSLLALSPSPKPPSDQFWKVENMTTPYPSSDSEQGQGVITP